MIQQLSCPSCSGRGRFFHICSNRWLDCLECGATGKVMGDPAWEAAGKAARKSRVETGLSLREEAARLGVTVVELSAFERGRAPLPGPDGKVRA